LKNIKFNKRFVNLSNQYKIIFLSSFFSFLLIFLRLFFLQVINNETYKKMSDQNRIRLIATEPIRGKILDKNGNVLVRSKLNYSLIIKPQFVSENIWQKYKYSIANLLSLDIEKLDLKYKNALKNKKYSINLVNNLSVDQIIKFKENQENFFGIEILRKVKRDYPYKTLGAHALGYTSAITNSEFKILSKKGYRLNDLIGRTGVEAAYEKYLRGEWGGEMIEVNSNDIVQKSLGVKPSKKGEDVTLTIDLSLQKISEEVLKDKKGGAVVVMDPRDGAIRAIASKPTFDLNFFTKDFKPEKEYNDLFYSKSKPLFSRALNAYDPGSVWKIVTALAGMESGKFPPSTQLQTFPCIVYGSQCFREHNDEGFGTIGYEDALRVSSNTFFYQIGDGVGVDEINRISKILGFNKLSGIEIGDQEDQGLIASSEWAKKGRGWGKPGETPWLPEDIASMSIGQFVVQTTPIQIARAYAVIANGGYLVTPHLSKLGKDNLRYKRPMKVDIDPQHLQVIKNGLSKVVQSGTGVSINYGSNNFPPISGKTGTAEDALGGPDHAWFVCFAPSENSELLIVAFAENTPGGGSVHALPMAKKILEEWHKNNKN
tara:strand:+ start:285 stop:2081 length:1797 start_codon:yes stop_codon:yes gene_type:complete